MASSGMLRRLTLVRTDVSEERSGELGTTLSVTSNRRKLRNSTHLLVLHCLRRLLVTANVAPSSPILLSMIKKALRSSETSVLRRAKRHNILEDSILFIIV
jgi:hypothetical protein